MISEAQLRRLARELDVRLGYAEKTYVNSWILWAIYTGSYGGNLLFKGGTALSKLYFPETWRYSEDLDFGVAGEYRGSEAALRDALEDAARISGIDFEVTKHRELQKKRYPTHYVDIDIQYSAILSHKNTTSLDIMIDEYVAFDSVAHRHSYEDVQFGSGKIVLNDVDGATTEETFDVSSDTGGGDGTVSISGDTLTINPTSNLLPGNEYAVRIDGTAIEDNAAPRNSYDGINNDDDLDFTTADTGPEFTQGSSTSVTVREDESVDLTSVLAVSDISSSDTLTWSVESAPSNGGVSGIDGETLNTDGSNSPFTLGTSPTYAPKADVNGMDSFDVEISDANPGTTSDTVTVDVTIDAVNDAPSLSVSTSDPTFTEDGSPARVFSSANVDTVEGGQNVERLELTVSNVADGSAEQLTVDGSSVALTDGTSVTTSNNGLAASVSVSGSTATVTIDGGPFSQSTADAIINNLAYEHTGDDPSTANDRTITLTKLVDAGGTTNGGDDTTTLSASGTVSVSSVNDAPTMSSDMRTLDAIDEGATDNSGTTVSSILNSDGTENDAEGDTLGVAVTGVDDIDGTWEYSTDGGSTWSAVSSVSAANALLLADDDYVRFLPDAEFSGNAGGSVTVRAWDQTSGSAGFKVDTTTTGGITAYSTTTAAVSITVDAVNDQPSFSLPASPDQTVTKTTSTQTVTNFIDTATFDPGPSESGQSINDFVVTTNDSSLFETDPDIDNSGDLTFTPASDATGTASVDVQVQDDGGTGNGGDDTSATKTFTITVDNQGPFVESTSVVCHSNCSGSVGNVAVSTTMTQSGGRSVLDVTVHADGNPSQTNLSAAAVGADASTEYRINVTATSFDPTVGYGNGDFQGPWAEQTPQPGQTNISLDVKPIAVTRDADAPAGAQDDPTSSHWDGTQVASETSRLVDVAFVESSGPNSAAFEGAYVGTDAQAYAIPTIDRTTTNPRIRLRAAAPHFEPGGTTLNTGLAQVHLPDSLVNNVWGGASSSQYVVTFTASSQLTTSPTETDLTGAGTELVWDGFHYSDGTIEAGVDNTVDTVDAASTTTSSTTVTFDGTGSADSSGIKTYEWDVDDDASYEKTGSQPTHDYGSVGNYTAILRVTDNNGNVGTDTLTVDLTPPAVESISRASSENPTSDSRIDFTVTFNQSVSGVDTSDFTATPVRGGVSAPVDSVTGSGSTYTVTVGPIENYGDLRLDLVDDDSITNDDGIALGGDGTTGAANGSYTSGENYTIQRSGGGGGGGDDGSNIVNRDDDDEDDPASEEDAGEDDASNDGDDESETTDSETDGDSTGDDDIGITVEEHTTDKSDDSEDPGQDSEQEDTLSVTIESENGGSVVTLDEETTGRSVLGATENASVEAVSMQVARGRTRANFTIVTYERSVAGRDDAGQIAAAARTFEKTTGSVSAGYLDVDHDFESDDLSGVSFQYSVRKSYLDRLGVAASDVQLYHSSDGETWRPVETAPVGENETHHHFESSASSFSVFAIGTGADALTVTTTDLQSETATVGEQVRVTVEMRNRGALERDRAVTLTADGDTVARDTLAIDSGQSAAADLVYTPAEPGEYNLAVDNETVGTLTVQQADESLGEETTGTDDEQDGAGFPVLPVVLVIGLLGVLLAAVGYRQYHTESP